MQQLLSFDSADYPKGWPVPTKSLAAQEKIGESALQANLHSLVETRLIPAKSRRFCYSYASTGQFTHMANLSGNPHTDKLAETGLYASQGETGGFMGQFVISLPQG